MDVNGGVPEPNQEDDPIRMLLEGLLGPEGASEALEAMRSQGFDLSSMEGLSNLGIPLDINELMGQMQFLVAPTPASESMNWKLVEDYSTRHAYRSGDPAVSEEQQEQILQALSIANLWLDGVTDFAAPQTDLAGWSRVDWVRNTLPGWKEICNPVAANASRAMSETIEREIDLAPEHLPEELASLGKTLSNIVPKMAAMAFGSQVSQALTAMAQESLGASDSGFPLTEDVSLALVPTNVAKFSEGLEIPNEEVLQFLAVREAAHGRLLSSVPWLRHDLQLAIIRYAEEIALDGDALTDAARSIDVSNPDSLNEAMAEGVFSVQPTQEQAAALERLETLLALIEGWIEVVTAEAVRDYLPNADALREMMRRRRVGGSGAERLLRQLVGLDMRPRQARNAAKIFTRVKEDGGQQEREALWSHPDRVPSAQALADPNLFFTGDGGEGDTLSEFDADLEKLLAGTLAWDEAVPLEDRAHSGPASSDSATREGDKTVDAQDEDPADKDTADGDTAGGDTTDGDTADGNAGEGDGPDN